MSSSNDPLALRNILSGIIITVIGGVILAFIIRDAMFSPPGSPAPIEPTATATMEEITPTETLPGPTPTIQTPELAIQARFSDFAICPRACKENEDVRTYPEGTKRLYAQWHYEDVPLGAHYERTWTLQGLGAWVQYDCIWPGPHSGDDQVVISEPQGFHSGTWEVTISVEEVVVLREMFVVEGDNTVWDPAGTFTSCYDR